MNILDFLTAQFFAHVFLSLVVAMLAFAAGFRTALAMQRRDFKRLGYTIIGSELYRTQKIEPAFRQPENQGGHRHDER